MTLSDLKSSLDIYQVVQKLGVKMDAKGKCSCPFHEDKHPSMQVSREKQIATCFSSNCDAGTMDVFDFVGRMYQFNVHESAKWLKETFMINDYKPTENSKPKPKQMTPEQRIEILEKAFNYFRNGYQIRRSNNGRTYVNERNIGASALEEAGITLAYNSAQFHHRDRFSLAEKQDFCKVGLLKENSHSNTGVGFTPWAPHCVIFPLKNKQGKVVSLYGRSAKWNSHFYLTNRQGLFPKYPDSNTQKIILTESIIDACTLLQYPSIRKEYSILALYGTNGFMEEHKEAVSQLENLNEVVLFLDGDQAGQTATEKVAKVINDLCKHLTISKVTTPENEDVNSLLEAHDKEIFIHLLKNRTVLHKPSLVSKTQERSDQESALQTQNPNNLFFRGAVKGATTPASYQIKGGIKKNGFESLKITLLTHNTENNRKFRDKLDLYEYKQIQRYCKAASGVVILEQEQLEADLNLLTDLLDQYRNTLQSKTTKNNPLKDLSKSLTSTELQTAVAFGKDQKLIEQINERIGKSGIVGEENNRLFLFVVAVSHLMKNPLNAIVQGNSGSGKSHLIKKVSHLVPQERVKRYTRLSEKVLFNFGEYDLVNTFIIIEDYDGIGEDAEYAIRELISNRILISGVSQKDDKNSGEIGQADKTVRGPIASMVATTKGEVYQDNATRVFFIAVDESNEQTQRIVAYKNQISAGEINLEDLDKQAEFLQKFVCSLQSYKVKNPFLKNIKLPVSHHQLRRLHELFTSFCEQITLLHQHQRTINPKGEIIAQKQDVKIAIELMFESIILKVDELDGSLREFYEQLKGYVKSKDKEYEFTRYEIRQEFKISKTMQHRYFESLLELEYIYQSGGYANRGYTYKIKCWDDNLALRKRIKENLKQQLEQL